MDNKIELIKFPSQLTDRIQPLDKCVFGRVETNWEKKLIAIGKVQMHKQANLRLTKSQFSQLLGDVWGESMKSKILFLGSSQQGCSQLTRPSFQGRFLILKKSCITRKAEL